MSSDHGVPPTPPAPADAPGDGSVGTTGTGRTSGTALGSPRRRWATVLALWIVLTAIGTVLGLVLPRHLLPTPASAAGTDVLHSLELFLVLAAPVASIIVALAVTTLWTGRQRGDPDVAPPPAPGPAPVDRAGRRASAAWVTVSAMLAAVLIVWGVWLVGDEGAAPPGALQVQVTGHQWIWTFAYPGTHVETRALVLPLGRPVEFDVTSVDVTHGFHPVNFGTQVDAVPGEVTVLSVTPDRLGPFPVRCTQICGLYHALMATDGVVVRPSAFAAWLVSQGTPVATADRLARVTG